MKVVVGGRYGFPRPSPKGFKNYASVLKVSDVSDFM